MNKTTVLYLTGLQDVGTAIYGLLSEVLCMETVLQNKSRKFFVLGLDWYKIVPSVWQSCKLKE